MYLRRVFQSMYLGPPLSSLQCSSVVVRWKVVAWQERSDYCWCCVDFFSVALNTSSHNSEFWCLLASTPMIWKTLSWCKVPADLAGCVSYIGQYVHIEFAQCVLILICIPRYLSNPGDILSPLVYCCSDNHRWLFLDFKIEWMDTDSSSTI